MGNLDQNIKNKISTQPTPDTSTDKECEPSAPESFYITNTETTHLIFVDIEKTGRVYADQTGWFLITSSEGNKYVCILYDYYANKILTEPLKNRTRQAIMRYYYKLYS